MGLETVAIFDRLLQGETIESSMMPLTNAFDIWRYFKVSCISNELEENKTSTIKNGTQSVNDSALQFISELVTAEETVEPTMRLK